MDSFMNDKARYRDLSYVMARSPDRESIGKILLANGFTGELYDPFELRAHGSTTLSINSIRFSGVRSIYLGEESLTVQPANVSVFYVRIREFHIGGERRV